MGAAVSPKTLTLFRRYLVKHTGLHFPPPRVPELLQKMEQAARAFGYVDVEGCLIWLMSSPLSRNQLDILAPLLTIGETYFLRDAESYRVLQEELLPELLEARRQGEKRLTIWSAGCSTGEEAYSIAILLERLIPDLKEWDIRLCATDLNREALEKAQRGVYRNWSFRNAPAWLFDHLVKLDDGRYEVPPQTRRLVEFTPFNLATDDYSSLFADGTVDILFCRNVMLYFHEELRVAVADRLYRVLRDGGSLFVSPSEVDHRIFSKFGCRRFSGALVFTKGEKADNSRLPEPAVVVTPFASEAVPPSPAPPSAPAARGSEPVAGKTDSAPGRTLSEASALAARGRYQEAVDAVAPLAAEGTDSGALELLARSYASLGRIVEARHYCEAAIAVDRMRPHTHYLLSIILEEQGLLNEAAAALKRTLYLDQDFLVAHFALGKLHRHLGKEEECRRHFANALHLLERRDQHEVVPEAAGLTAGRLAEMIRAALEGRSAHA
ncbi:chemotaxis protein CheR [Geomonas sp. RF6]|uniref:CheR family methyltransferase n=1 Tax=Geomonas sp. RF6 TaxID=2897342 RepID=UPI001E2D92BD|nr:CheR family methyltransferase [Geomonas sp. RF6]UFS69600.1 chemotaxis protein CheR [Geomonas sp. RF6]